ncbi:integrin alpha-V-like isoform X2 [Corticium candelabrum]|uniref:integrin alpha-V-like isoform X2 n=1 Tax=Corticium candelabrum TaxID=121492 RepID=UPI002E2731F8|nr:integrin alpha-V-like isoform X2 [Corticium candelabrum]
MIVILLHLLATLTCANAFNVDTSFPILKNSGRAGEKMQFGAAVTIHQSVDGPRLLVGAPKSQGMDKTVSRPGAVYKCTITNHRSCQYEELDEKEKRPKVISSLDVDRSNQLFGQTLVSSKGNIIVCAPRFKTNESLTVNNTKQYSYYPDGRCLLFNSSYDGGWMYSTEAVSDPPERANEDSFVGSQFGFSAALNNGENIVIGSPGWRFGGGNAFFENFSYILTGDYGGFSVVIGQFLQVSKLQTIMYAVGKPKANLFTGVVDIFIASQDVQLKRMADVTGDKEPGAMFGYALASLDLNSDGFDDLIVSAPFHGTFGVENTGKIFVFLSGKHTFLAPVEIVGPEKGGFFGLAVSAISDIDRDGFGDVAVSAPFLGSSSGGTVYIYRGSQFGIIETFSQVIRGETFNLMSFGYALTSAVDIDDNKYPDLLIGAYLSESAVLLRTRPIVIVNSSLTADPDVIDLYKPNCHYDGKNTSCFNLSLCLSFQVKPGADPIQSLRVTYEIVLDTLRRKLVSRGETAGAYKTAINTNMVLNGIGEKTCTHFLVAVHSAAADRIYSFDNIMRITDVDFENEKLNNGFPQLKPVLDFNLQKKEIVNSVKVQLLCIYDPCSPDLNVEFLPGSTSQLSLGSSQGVLLLLQLMTLNDTAYGAQLNISVNISKLSFNQVQISDPRIKCDQVSTGVLCQVGYPLRSYDSLKLPIMLREVNIEESDLSIPVSVTVISRHEEASHLLHDNEKLHSIRLVENATIYVNGSSYPSQLNVGASRIEDIISPEAPRNVTDKPFAHKYTFRNGGPSAVDRIDVRVWLPTFALNNVQVQSEADIKCNLLHLGEDQQKWQTASRFDVPLCGDVYTCAPVDCVISQHVEPTQAVSVTLTATVNLQVFLDFALSHHTNDSNVVASVTTYVEANATATSQRVLYTHSSVGFLKLSVEYISVVRPCIAIWILVVSVVSALLLLSGAVWFLHLIGFFKTCVTLSVADLIATKSVNQGSFPGANGATTTNNQQNVKTGVKHEGSKTKTNSVGSSKSGSKSGSLDNYRRVKRHRRTTSSQSSDDEGITLGTFELSGEARSTRTWSRPSVKDYSTGTTSSSQNSHRSSQV